MNPNDNKHTAGLPTCNKADLSERPAAKAWPPSGGHAQQPHGFCCKSNDAGRAAGAAPSQLPQSCSAIPGSTIACDSQSQKVLNNLEPTHLCFHLGNTITGRGGVSMSCRASKKPIVFQSEIVHINVKCRSLLTLIGELSRRDVCTKCIDCQCAWSPAESTAKIVTSCGW